MIISKNTTIDDILKMKDGEDVFITKDVVLDKEKLSAVFSHFKKSYISIHSGYDNNQSYSSFETTLYSEDEISNLLENVKFIQENFDKKLSFDAGFNGVDKAVFVSRLINQIVDEINSLRINDRPLSPFEKFIYVYHFASNRKYVAEPDFQDQSYSRNLLSCLTSDSIVCVGFSNILTTILNKVNVPTAPANIVNSNEGKLSGKHLANYVRIEDDIYGIHGIYYADASADAAESLEHTFGNNSFNKALRRIQDVPIKNSGVFFDATTSNKHEDIRKPIEQQIKPAPTIMSKLFPEISGGLSQAQMIEEFIPYFVQKNNLKENLKNSTDSILNHSQTELFDVCVSRVFDFEDFFGKYKGQDFEEYLNNTLCSLKFAGFSNEEIISRFNLMIEDSNSQEFIKNICVKNASKFKPFTPEMITKKEMIGLRKFVGSLSEKLKTFEDVSVSQNKETVLNQLLVNLSNEIIAERLYKNYKSTTKTKALILNLLNNGVSIEEIKTFLSSRLEGFDMAETFIKTDETLSKKVGLDESEFYFGYDQHNIDFIFNEPYEAMFETLSKEATFVSQEKFEEAVLKIFLAQGYTNDKATSLRDQMLRHTNIENFSKTMQ